jgi:sugar lactone lactonase YvrE
MSHSAPAGPLVLRPKIRFEITVPLAAGESPCWDGRAQALYFVDMTAPALWRLYPQNGELRSWPMPAPIGSLSLCTDGRVLVALKTGVHFLNLETGRLDLLANPEGANPDNRLSDGKVGPDGRFWVGSMNGSQVQQPTAALFRIDSDGSCARVLDGLLSSNGLAWSPDGRRLYHSDSRGKFVQVFDYDLATGTLANQRRLCELDESEGRPDGAAVDVEGYYWSAGVSAGCINRIAPNGRIVEKYLLPVDAPTMPCFGGPNLTTLYLTSLSTDRAGVQQTGTLISFEVDVAGVAVARFRAPMPALT